MRSSPTVRKQKKLNQKTAKRPEKKQRKIRGRGEPRGSGMVRGGGANKVLPIETPALPLDELNKITGNFGRKSLIGEGSYGRVFYANLNNRASAAIKKLHTGSSQETDSDFTAQENANNNKILAYQYATIGSLHDVLHGRKGVQGAEPGPVHSWVERVKIAYGAARGLEFLHEKVQPPIVHRDVRSSNVLLSDDFFVSCRSFPVLLTMLLLRLLQSSRLMLNSNVWPNFTSIFKMVARLPNFQKRGPTLSPLFKRMAAVKETLKT
ncbi:hypothetical protein DCAR_0101157 [Daucus carota subsp. sativus]|uniref:Protein kinase domain-containing protein n=1 Tax=Daucus carota subsp. sativus TaxID=79200 RepID=A0AAF0W5J1_DAUCS|nr:hypothetical protein DCAR_0101157 [Daucus carota subsp. sativus]